MKKNDVIKELKKNGWYLDRQGKNHEIWANGKGEKTALPRHREVKEFLAKNIIANAKLNPGN